VIPIDDHQRYGAAMVVELRVHGVSGASAEDVLAHPVLDRVAGDNASAFSRPRPGFGSATGPGGATLEAYRWGGLTSGAATRALWLLLLPFMLANLAMWLHPVAGRGGTAVVRTLCRVFALSITATYVLSIVGVSDDLVAWQCASTGNTCASRRSYLAWLSHGFFAEPGRRLAVCAILPILAVGLLWLLGRRTWARYESFPAGVDLNGDGLASPGFWNGKALVGRLRCLHIAAAYATLSAVVSGVLASATGEAPARVMFIACAIVLALCVLGMFSPPMVNRDRLVPWSERLAQGLRAAALLLTVAVLVDAMRPRDRFVTPGSLPGYATTVTLLFTGQCALLVLLGVITACQRKGKRRYLLGLGAPIVASFSLAVAAAFTAGLSFRVADFLDRSANPAMAADFGANAANRVAPPAPYAWASLGFFLTLVAVLVALALIRLIFLSRLRRTAQALTDQDFGADRPSDPGRARQIDRAIADAQLTDGVSSDLVAAFAPLAVIAAIFTTLTLQGYKPLGLTSRGRPGVLVGVMTNLGTYLIGLFAVALLVLGALAYRNAGLRRIVGVLWDIGTFWPRSAHPLSPPCYSERAVPELVLRTRYLAGRGGVILSGHSQGSVLAAATTLQLPPTDGVAMLTYGSPIRRLYARAFPAYVDDRVVDRAAAAVGGRWINLWRHTDPIGGPIASPGVRDVRFPEPPGFARRAGDPAYPAIRTHSGYPDDSGFSTAVAELSSELSGERAGVSPVAAAPVPGPSGGAPPPGLAAEPPAPRRPPGPAAPPAVDSAGD
jgi:hypothetical protein